MKTTFLSLLIFLLPVYGFEIAHIDLQNQISLEQMKLQAFLDTVKTEYAQSPLTYSATGNADPNHQNAYWKDGHIIYLNNAYSTINPNGQIEIHVSFKEQQPGISALLKGTELKFIALGKQAQIINTQDGINENEQEITSFLCERVSTSQGKKFATFNVSNEEVNLSHTLPPPYTGCN